MNNVVEFWPIISAIVMVAAIGVAFRSEVNVRIKVLEEKLRHYSPCLTISAISNGN